MFPGTVFNREEGVWVWQYEGNDLFMDINEVIRFKVESLIFLDVGPVKKPPENADGSAPTVVVESPLKIICTIAEQGLGLLSWWDPQAEAVVE